MSKPSPIIVHKKQSKKIISYEENLSRQLSNVSNEDYHVVKSASVPFVWESQPGTPKVRSRENSLPPLTPPPSYLKNATKKPITKPKARFFQNIFPKRKSCAPQQNGPSTFLSYNSSSSSSSSLSLSSPRPTSYSVSSSPMIHSRSREREEHEDMYEVTSSDMCFGNVRSRGCYSSMFKKVLLGDFM